MKKTILSIFILLLLVLTIVGNAFAVNVNELEESQNTEDLFSQLTLWDKVKYISKDFFSEKTITTGAVCNENASITWIIAGESEFNYTCEGHTNCIVELWKKADGETTFIEEVYLPDGETYEVTGLDTDARYILELQVCDNLRNPDFVDNDGIMRLNIFWYSIIGLSIIGLLAYLFGGKKK